MKKKSIFKLLIVIMVMLSIIIFPFPTGADSGWDGGYDSGSSSSWSSDSGSSWSSSDSDSSWSSSDSGSSDPSDFVFFVVIAIIFLFVFTTTSTQKIQNVEGSECQNIEGEGCNFIDHISLEEIQKVLSDFDYEAFKQQVYDTYKEIQIAWMNFDYETLQKYCTNELYNLYKSQLEALKVKNQQNIMENFSFLDFVIKQIETNDNIVSLKVLAKISCNDYVIDCKDRKVLRGRNDKKVCYTYEMTFTRSIGQADNVCPNCYAPLENQQTNICKYCGSTIISENYNWVLSKKQVKDQYFTSK